MEKADGPSFSLIVPVHDSEETLPAVLGALMRGMARDDELIAADDRSGDGSVDACRKAGVEPVSSSRPPGAAGTRNFGASLAGREWLLFVDSDALPPENWREELSAGLAGVDAVQAVYARDTPGGPSAFYKNYYYHYTFTRRIRTETIRGCGTFFFAVRREVFEALGGFDERIAGASIEDADFAARLNARGGRIRLLKHLEITHLRRYDLASLLSYDWKMVRAKTRFLLRRGLGGRGLSLSMAGPGEMLPFGLAAAGQWLVPAGLAAALLGFAPGVAFAAGGAAVVVLTQGFFWWACMRQGGLRGLAACFVGLADLLVPAPAALAGLAESVLGRRY